MKKVRRPDDSADALWQEESMSMPVFVCYGSANGEGKAIRIEREGEPPVKTLYVFKSESVARQYARSFGPNFTHESVKLGFLIEKLREVYSDDTSHQVRCVLTGVNKDDILHELDVLWQLLTN